jgi:uncharacterized damage-inducible protein DinB
MTTEAAGKETISTKLIGRWEQCCSKLISLGELFPEDQYEYRPTTVVRTFADVLRHAAFWNRYVADSVRGKKADDTSNELPKAQHSTKAKILDALRQSTRESIEALREQREISSEIAETIMTFIEHNSEHYGQLVVYARLNGIVPPSSAA